MQKRNFINRDHRLSCFLVLSFFLVFSCYAVAQQPAKLTILHTNDLHAQFIPTQAEWVQRPPKPEIGGMAALKAYVDRERNDATIILDAGDTQTGTMLSNIEIEGALGGGFIQMMNQIGYHASVIGNHEFDKGWENFLNLSKLAEFDWLCANLWDGNHLFARRGFQIYRTSGLAVGVIGLTIAPLAGLVAASSLGEVESHPVAETAQGIIDQIDPETDCIILLTHQGFEEDSLLAERVHGADIIVGGHSHTVLKHPRRVNGILIVQAGARCRYLGRLDVTVSADTISEYKGRLIPLWVDSIRVDQQMAGMAADYQSRIDAEYGLQIGVLHSNWERAQDGESNIGNYLADVIRDVTSTDFAVINSGGIRKDMAAGPITIRDIHEILPFQNQIVGFTCAGRDLIRLIETNARMDIENGGGILQVSGLRYSCKMDEPGKIQIVDAQIKGQPIVSDAIYSGATVDYVAKDNAIRHMGFTPSGLEPTGSMLTDVVVQYIRKHPNAISSVEGRITVLR